MIQKILIYAVIIGMIFTGCSSKKEESVKEKSNWEKIRECNVTFPVNIAGAYDQNRIITAGFSGEIHYSNDGGTSWQKGTNFSKCRFALEIVNEKLAWCIGNGPGPRITRDGGAQWDEPKSNGLNGIGVCRFLSAYDDKHAWISTGTILLASANGGNSWKNIQLPSGTEHILAMHLSDSGNGYLFDSNGSICITNNNGATWEKKHFGISSIFNKAELTTQSAAMRFIGNNGMLVLWKIKGDREWVVFITADGGKSWQQEKIQGMFGAPYLSRDMKLFTVKDPSNNIMVFKKIL